MLDWISANTEVLGLLISLCTLLVWIVYAQLLYAGFPSPAPPQPDAQSRARDAGSILCASSAT